MGAGVGVGVEVLTLKVGCEPKMEPNELQAVGHLKGFEDGAFLYTYVVHVYAPKLVGAFAVKTTLTY